METNRRDFLKKSSLLAMAGIAGSAVARSVDKVNTILDKEEKKIAMDAFTLPALPYAYDALEPHIDKLTMEIHHDKHHKAYVDNLNKAALVSTTAVGTDLPAIFQHISNMPVVIRNNAGGHYNHSLFWQLMKPNGGGEPYGKIADAIKSNFGSFEEFKKKFNEAAMTRFGSGWAWLVVDKSVLDSNRLIICSTPNQDNPLMDLAEVKGKPVLTLDVWEHAYYLKYQNKRADYVNGWWNVVNWDKVNELFEGK